jgi:hypothetical protein
MPLALCSVQLGLLDPLLSLAASQILRSTNCIFVFLLAQFDRCMMQAAIGKRHSRRKRNNEQKTWQCDSNKSFHHLLLNPEANWLHDRKTTQRGQALL